jgi:hypothetical protein
VVFVIAQCETSSLSGRMKSAQVTNEWLPVVDWLATCSCLPGFFLRAPLLNTMPEKLLPMKSCLAEMCILKEAYRTEDWPPLGIVVSIMVFIFVEDFKDSF